MAIRVLRAAIPLCLAASLALADSTVNVTVKGGKASPVATIGAVDAACKGGDLPAVATQPQHGALELRQEDKQVTNRKSPCFGKTVAVGVAYYTPAGGYLGSDVFVLQTNLSNGKAKVRNNLTYRVTVE